MMYIRQRATTAMQDCKTADDSSSEQADNRLAAAPVLGKSWICTAAQLGQQIAVSQTASNRAGLPLQELKPCSNCIPKLLPLA